MVISSVNYSADKAWCFLRNRLITIMPMYWFATSIFIILGWVTANSQVTNASPSYVINSYFLIPDIAPNGNPYPLVYPGWTLSYEILFYVFFAVSLTSTKLSQRICICATLIVLWHGLHYLVSASDTAIVYSSGNIILEFLYGLLIGWMYITQRIKPSHCCIALSASVFLFYLSCFAELHAVPRFVLWGLPASLLVYSLLSCDYFISRHLHFPFILKIGDNSYLIYLFHIFMANAIYSVIFKIFTDQLYLTIALDVLPIITTGIIITCCIRLTKVQVKLK